MTHPVCAYCGGHVTEAGTASQHWHHCAACSAKLTWPGSGVSPSALTLTLTQEDLDHVRTALFAAAWASPEDSSQESEWLALEQRLWRQDPRARRNS